MMSSVQAAVAPRVPPSTPPEPGASQIAWLGAIEDHILVLGGQGSELMRALLRAGATNVTHLRTHGRPEADSADLVIVPRVPSLEWLATTLPSIHRALTSHGRVVLRAGIQPASQPQIRRMLTLHGLSTIRIWADDDGQMISAERPRA
jgi:hypothetical protein